MELFIPRETPINIEEIRENSICLHKGDKIEFPSTPVLRRRETVLLLAGQTVVLK